MKKLFSLFLILFFFAITGSSVIAQNVEVSTGGPVTNYTTLKLAFDAINAGTHTGVILIEFATGTTETAPAVLNSSGAGSASYTSITIRPRVDGIVVTSNYSTNGRGLIELNGADNVTIDGDNPNTIGTNRNLTITNGATNTTTYTSVIRFALSTLVSTGNNNTVKNCIINGSATGRNISTATSTTGTEHTTYGILVGGGASTLSATTAPSAITSVNTTIGSGITITSFTADNNQITACARGIAVQGSATTVANLLNISNNVIGSSTSGNTTTVYSRGMTLQGFDNATIAGNTIRNIESYLATAIFGIGLGEVSASGQNAIVEKNIIIKMFSQNPTTYGVHGIALAAGTSNTVRNNFISDLNHVMTGGAAFGSTFGVNGIRISSSTNHKIYYNTVSLFGTFPGTAASSLSSACLLISSTSLTGIDCRNNIFSNTMTGGTTSIAHVSILLPSAGTSAMNLTLNNNALYCGTTSSQGIAHVGTSFATIYTAANFNSGTITPSTNLRAYTSTLSAAGTNDNASFASTSAAPFTSSTDLHIPNATVTQLESGGVTISGITTDIDGDTRNASTPDIGADEFNGVGVDLAPPSISYSLLTNTSSVSNRTFTSVAITDVSGVNTNPGTLPRCYYKRSGDANAYVDNGPGTDGWKYVEANGSSTPFDFTIDYSLLNGGGGVSLGDVVQYFVVAEDLAGTPNVGINSGTFAVAQTTCDLDPSAFPIGGTINSYQIVGAPLSGTYTVGLSAMRELLGKDLRYEPRTRKVKVMVPDENYVDRTILSKDPNKKEETSTSYISKDAMNRPLKEVEIEETYYELTENGSKYTGPNYASYKNASRNGSTNGNPTDLIGAYTTITAAIGDLNSRGVSGPVTFVLIDNGTYPSETYPIQFNNNISGISATNTVTLKPQTGVSSIIPGSIASNATIRILSNYVTIDGSNSGGTDRSLTIQNNSATTPSVILVGSTGTNPITSVMVKNCTITNGSTGSTAIVVSDATLGTAGYFNTITIQNNLIEKCFNGIYAIGGTTPQNGLNLFVTSNSINSTGVNGVTGTGVYVQGVNGGNISQNDIGNIASATASSTQRIGIWLATGTNNVTIERNRIHDISFTGTGGWPAAGIKISNGGTGNTNIIIKNNMIFNITADGDSYTSYGGTYDPIGIYCFASAQSGIGIYNNSINLYGSTINLAGAYSIGIALDDGSIADIRNNMISNTLGLLSGTGAGALCIAVETGNTQLTNNNYNCYYSNPTTGVKGLVKVGTAGADNLTMADVRTATTKDQLSFNSLPLFVSATDLHIQTSDLTLNGRGTYISGVNSDFDGDSRPTSQSTTVSPVDVGCDQYTEGSFNPNICAPSGDDYYDGGLIAVEVVSGSIGVTEVRQYPGVRTPNNTLLKNGSREFEIKNPVRNTESPNKKINKTKRDGTSGGQTDAMAVNVPWIYWELTDLTSPGADLRFYFNEEMLATILEADLKLSFWNGSAWDNGITQTVNPSGNYIELSLPGGFVWGSTALFAMADGNAPLPVVLSSFDAAVMKRDVSLSWTTESEINNQGFSVERRIKSQDNRYSEWKEVAFVEGKGNTTTRQSYSYSDKKLNSGTYQYRLKQVDFNGNYEYHSPSNNADLVIGKPGVFDISQNYPNPSNPTSNIDFQMPFDGKVSLRVYDILGKEVATLVDGYRTADFYTAKFDGTNLSTGIYFYRIIAESGTERFTKTLKMILVK